MLWPTSPIPAKAANSSGSTLTPYTFRRVSAPTLDEQKFVNSTFVCSHGHVKADRLQNLCSISKACSCALLS